MGLLHGMCVEELRFILPAVASFAIPPFSTIAVDHVSSSTIHRDVCTRDGD